MNMSSLGAQVSCAGVIGDDLWGEKLISILNEKGINSTYIDKIKNFKNFNAIKNVDVGFICTPSKFHVTEAINLLEKNIHLFIEKPLGASLQNINKLRQILKKRQN